MPSLDETHDDKILRILSNAKECLTVKDIIKTLHDEQGGGVSYTPAFVESRLSKLMNVRANGDKYCYCSGHQQLLQEERNAWSAWRSQKDLANAAPKDIQRLHDNASDASTRLRQHLNSCPKCK
jgi:hypothetical protein